MKATSFKTRSRLQQQLSIPFVTPFKHEAFRQWINMYVKQQQQQLFSGRRKITRKYFRWKLSLFEIRPINS